MEKSKFWRYVALGVAAVLLVFFITQFVRSFGESARENLAIRDAFEQVKVEESNNEQPAVTAYMTLNWHEFSDKVVIQVGNNSRDLGNTERSHIQKDKAYWYYVFDKDNFKLEGVLRVGVNTNIFTLWNTFDYYSVDNTTRVDVLGFMQHEFENYYTGDIVDINGVCISSNVEWNAFGTLYPDRNGIDGIRSECYETSNSSTYLPADGSYRISMFDASLTAPVLLKQCYQYVDNKDVMLDLSEQYFCCYSNSVAKIYNDIMKGYIPFDLRMFIDYTPHLTTAFDFDNLGNMYNLVKDYNYYVG